MGIIEIAVIPFFERSEPSASEVREAILPETTKKNLPPVPNFGEGGGQPKAGRQARRKLQKGTIQNFWEGGCRPKIFGKYHILGSTAAGHETL